MPQEVYRYFLYIETALMIRYLALRAVIFTLTVLRQIRGLEMRRDEPLLDAALKGLESNIFIAVKNIKKAPRQLK